MATVLKMIKAMINFGHLQPAQLLALGYIVLKALTGNVNFTTAPVDLNALKTGLDAYSALIGEAADGSRKALLLRNQQGDDIIRMLRTLASYVELNCKDDINIFLTSGFTPRSSVRAAAQPLSQPMITNVDQGPSGTLLASATPVRKVKTYELRIGATGPGGATPTSWSTQTVSGVRSAVPISGLTPGTMYAIQVRAFGTLGYTGWSDSATRMCI